MDLAPDTEAGFHSVDWISFKLSVFRAQFTLKGINIPLKISHYIMGGAQVPFLYYFYRVFWGLIHPFYI